MLNGFQVQTQVKSMFAQVEQRFEIERQRGRTNKQKLVRPLIVFLSQLDYDDVRKFSFMKEEWQNEQGYENQPDIFIQKPISMKQLD